MAKNATSKPATKGMKVESVPIDSLTPDPANARRHNQRNLDAIKASLKRFGQQKPIVVDGDGIIRAGNGTWTAAKALGWSHIDVVRTELTGSDAVAFAIADNRTGELAEWDEDVLAQTLAQLQIDDEELAKATGFDLDNENEIGSTYTLEQIDAKPPPRMGWVLIGIEIERWGEVASIVESVGEIDGVIMETCVGD